MEIFDEDKAVELIKAKLAANPEVKGKYTDNDILEVIDLIWDFYEANGMLNVEMDIDDSDDNLDTSRIIDYVVRMIKKDKGTRLIIDDIPYIVEAELEYEDECNEL